MKLFGYDFKINKRASPVVPEKVWVEPDGQRFTEYSTMQPPSAEYSLYDILDGYYGGHNMLELFYCLPEIFAPINEIASRVSDASWQLRKDWNEEIDYKNSTFNKIFSQPNPLSTFKDLIYMACVYEICTGKQFFYKNQPSLLPDEFSSVVSLWNLPPNWVEVDRKRNVDLYSSTDISDLINYYYVPQGGSNRIFATNTVKELLRANIQNTPENGYPDLRKIRGPLSGADKAIKNLLPVYEARGVIYIKRGAMGFLVSRKTDESGTVALTKSEKQEAINDFNGTYGVTGSKATIGVTSVPLDFVKTSMSIQEMEPFDETLADAVAIYACLRVPRHLVPSKDNSTFANASADLKSFYADTIIPMAKRYAVAFDEFFKLADIRRYIYPDFSHIAILQENQKEKSEVDKNNGSIWLQRWQNGVSPLNDWIRAIDGTPGTGSIYEKKLFELTPDEITQAKQIINLKSNVSTQTTSENPGTQA